MFGVAGEPVCQAIRPTDAVSYAALRPIELVDSGTFVNRIHRAKTRGWVENGGTRVHS